VSDKRPKFKQARMIVSALALVLVLGVGWELYSGVAIHKTGGPSHRAIHPGLYWFEMVFQGSITVLVVWAAYRTWRSR
jgi:hypothetical protein